MAQPHKVQFSTARLRGLQAAINAEIDNFVTTTSAGGKPDEATLAKLGGKIAGISEQIKSQMIPANIRIITLGFQPTVHMAIRIAIDLGLFGLITPEGTTLDELVEKTKVDRDTVFRVARTLSSHHIILELDEHKYGATDISLALTAPDLSAWMRFAFDSNYPLYLNIPAYLKKTNYEPMTANKNATIEATGLKAMEYIARTPATLADFNSAMQFQNRTPESMRPVYPFNEETLPKESVNLEDTWLVDVGGGRGYFLKEVHARFPDLFDSNRQGRIILQDIPSVAADVDPSILPPNVEAMAHNAFDPQPITGAKYYFYRKVFHGFSDDLALVTLKSAHGAMKKGHSKLLIWELVLPNKGAGTTDTSLDMNMLNMAGKERNERQWSELLSQGGFVLTKVHRAQLGSLAIIEADLA